MKYCKLHSSKKSRFKIQNIWIHIYIGIHKKIPVERKPISLRREDNILNWWYLISFNVLYKNLCVTNRGMTCCNVPTEKPQQSASGYWQNSHLDDGKIRLCWLGIRCIWTSWSGWGLLAPTGWWWCRSLGGERLSSITPTKEVLIMLDQAQSGLFLRQSILLTWVWCKSPSQAMSGEEHCRLEEVQYAAVKPRPGVPGSGPGTPDHCGCPVVSCGARRSQPTPKSSSHPDCSGISQGS